MNLVINKIKFKELERVIKGLVYYDEPMANHTSFKVGGPAEILIMPTVNEDIYNILKFSKENDIPINVIGAGTNLLVSDKGIKGIVIKINSSLENIFFSDEKVKVSAGVKVSKLLRECMNKNLSGLEFLTGIPGTVGGATCMNAGISNQSISMFFLKGLVIDMDNLDIKELSHKDFFFDYRWSIIQKGRKIILDAVFNLKKDEFYEISERVKILQDKRLRTQPLNLPNAGCIWKNPPETFAGKLIEEAGLKGYSIGGASISNLHANFIVNSNNAKAQDIYDLIRYVEETVYNKFNICLEREIKLFGLW